MSAVVVYNTGGVEKIDIVPLKQAIKMLHRGVARIHTEDPEGDRFGPYVKPVAIELVNYIFAKWLYQTTGRVIPSKTAVLRRDNYVCAYCGRTGTTIDHVLPRSRGGKSTWENLVAACQRCNGTKADRTPKEAGMKLTWLPYVPEGKNVYG